MYKEEILEHYRNPHNFGILAKPTASATLYNPLCGDKIILQVQIQNGIVAHVAFQGEGCAISKASASLLTDYMKKKKVTQLIKIDKTTMISLVGISVSPGRLKCLLLPYEAMKRLLILD